MQFLQCLNKMRIKQSAAWCWAPKSSPCHQMVSRHHCSSLTFSLREPGRDKSERCNKVLVTKVSWGCWKPLFCVCATLSLVSPQQAGALHVTSVLGRGAAPAAPHTARLRNAAEYFYGADLDNSVDSPLAFSFSLMFQTTHGVPTLH